MLPKLEDTAVFMLSDNYKDRFIGEYWQTKIRYERLKRFCDEIEAARVMGVSEPSHDCPLELLRDQQAVMGRYLHDLEIRAIIEKVDLNDIFCECKLDYRKKMVANAVQRICAAEGLSER